MATEKDFIEQYKQEGVYNSPRRSGKVDEEYIIRKCEYIFSNYVRSTDDISWYSRDRFQLLRQYAAGMQSETIYQKRYYGDLQNTSRSMDNNGIDIGGASSSGFNYEEFARKALSHINWKIMSPMPKIMNKIHSSYYGSMYDIHIECIDENSMNEQDFKKWQAWVDSQAEMISFMKNLQAKTQMPYKEPDKKFRTIEELELHEASGGFKLNSAKEGEKVIKDSWNVANEDELMQKIRADLATLNVAAVKVEYDREIGKEVPRYVDPEYAVIQRSQHYDFRDSSYAGEMILVPVYKLQAYGLDPKELPAVAKRYAGMFSNPEWTDRYELYSDSTEGEDCGFFKVPVLDVEFIEVDVLSEDVLYNTRYGTEQIREYKSGESLSANKQYQATYKHRVYQAKWVVGTKILFDYGLKPNQPSRDKDQSLLSYHFIKGVTEQSLVEQLMPVLDDFQFTWLKFQDAKASAVKSGLAIEFSSLMGMKLGGQGLEPFDVLRMYRTTGDLFYRARQRGTNMSQPNPITPLQGNDMNLLNGLAAALDLNARLIEEISGINPVSLGATPDSRAGKAVTEMSVSSSASPIKNIFDKLFQLKAHASLDILQRVQLDMRNSPTVRKRYESVIGQFGVKTLVEAEGKMVRFGTKLVVRPSQEDIAQIQQYIGIALQSGKNGIPLLTIPEAMRATRQLREGATWRDIELYLDFKEKEKAEEANRQAMATQQAQAQYAQQLEQQKAQNAQLAAQIDAQKNIGIDNNKFKNESQLEGLKSSLKLKEIEKEGQMGARVR